MRRAAGDEAPLALGTRVCARPPAGFVLEDPRTWPRIDGRIEFVNGRLVYMPPCGDVQLDVCTAVTGILFEWVKAHPEFGAHTGGFRRAPPLLAVEVAGDEQGEADLREKARWYLGAGVEVVWLILPDTRSVLVVTREGESRHRSGERLAEPCDDVRRATPARRLAIRLPGLEPYVAEFFRQLDE